MSDKRGERIPFIFNVCFDACPNRMTITFLQQPNTPDTISHLFRRCSLDILSDLAHYCSLVAALSQCHCWPIPQRRPLDYRWKWSPLCSPITYLIASITWSQFSLFNFGVGVQSSAKKFLEREREREKREDPADKKEHTENDLFFLTA